MAPLSFDDLGVGDQVELHVDFPAQKVAEFTSLTGDDADFHSSEDAARRFGFDGRIVHGLLVQSPLSALLGTTMPGPTTVINTITSKFHTPTYVGEGVDYVLRVTRLTPAVQAVLLEFEAKVGDRKVMSGTAMCSFITPREP